MLECDKTVEDAPLPKAGNLVSGQRSFIQMLWASLCAVRPKDLSTMMEVFSCVRTIRLGSRTWLLSPWNVPSAIMELNLKILVTWEIQINSSPRSKDTQVSGQYLQKFTLSYSPFEAWILSNDTLTYDLFCPEGIFISAFELEYIFWTLWRGLKETGPTRVWKRGRRHICIFSMAVTRRRSCFTCDWNHLLVWHELLLEIYNFYTHPVFV